MMSKGKLKIICTAAFMLVWLSACGAKDNVEQSPGVDHPETAGFRVITRTELENPKPAFNFELTDQNNSPVSLQDLRGQVVMITFIYTHCPEACPLVAANFVAVQNRLPEAIDSHQLALVLVTTDPARDTPDRLQKYTNALQGKWSFLTGSLEEVQTVWDGYDVYWEIKERTKEVVVYHSYKTYLIDQSGDIRFEFVGVWYPDDIIPDILKLIEE